MISDRLRRQIDFILEADRLKQVIRHTYIMPDPETGESRNENSAEHSWQLALMALLLAEHANQPVDPVHVAKMVLIHDIVEVDAGDTFAFDVTGNLDKEKREQQAAERLFGLLPADQGGELRALWEEFETRQTPAAKFANALDRCMPALHNFHNHGGSWRDHDVTLDRVRVRMAPIADGSQALAEMVEEILAAAVASGILAQGEVAL
ncbi:MAG: HD domain-containing protein [Caldilineaceae bacterium]|nr:HD domain-containing protein [Caldilineaceae bacterium]MBP8108849.1 HD domain-containing protein [Caldilineaceae bacterium]MBP8124417.1 HD domain-containing protein [Caldilineaceae bacterium]MBP9072214.1 HD domain-containing protein [Caldilineaceae bacterium]